MSDCVIFENNGEIDIRGVTTFGVSSKENDNPIGHFGTGLKYAIAILLRHDQKITIFSGLQQYDFSVETHDIRVDKFDIITMNGVPQAWTTELGKNWEFWQAFREVYCNCQDERGLTHKGMMPQPEVGKTKIIVTGEKTVKQFDQIDEILLQQNCVAVGREIEVHKGEGQFIYYQGIRVDKHHRQAMFNYNLTTKITLTEDRTVKESWLLQNTIARFFIGECKDETLLRSFCSPVKQSYEARTDFDWGIAPSDLFMDIMRELIAHNVTDIKNNSLMAVFTKNNKVPVKVTTKQPSDLDSKRLELAINFCKKLGYEVDRYPIHLAENLGTGILGRALDDTIYVSDRCMLQGTKIVASTILEEFLHLDRKLIDYTVEMQNFLFETIITLGEQVIGDPL